jgi:hypothetical protein
LAEHGIKIVEKDGVFLLSGVLNEYADFSSLLAQQPPLKLNLRNVSRLNSIGIRNLLKFLADWGPKPFEYHETPSEFVDQVNMIPALLGPKGHGQIKTLFVPYECTKCDHEAETLCKIEEFEPVKEGNEAPVRKCPKCGGEMAVLTDSFFVFLTR